MRHALWLLVLWSYILIHVTPLCDLPVYIHVETNHHVSSVSVIVTLWTGFNVLTANLQRIISVTVYRTSENSIIFYNQNIFVTTTYVFYRNTVYTLFIELFLVIEQTMHNFLTHR